MSSEIAREGTFWLHSVLLGMAVTLVYDFLRIFRRVFPHGIFWISIEDLIYWCVVAGSFFSLLYLENNGTFRWFCVFGAAVGMLVVKSTASPFLVKAGARFGH